MFCNYKCYAILVVLIVLLNSCKNDENTEIPFKGEKTLTWDLVDYDSVEIKSEPVSWSGFYFSTSDALGFMDEKTCELHFFDWTSGDFLKKVLKKGHSKGELPYFCCASALVGDSNRVAIYGVNNYLYMYDLKKDNLENYGFVNFGYEHKGASDDFENPSNYKLCNSTMLVVDSNSIVIPLARNAWDFDGWYENSHIWGVYDYKNKEFKALKGHIPMYYRDHPVPLFERFSLCKVNDDIYTTHMLDSLIYIHKNLDEPALAFGFEPSGADRKYTCKENSVLDAVTAFEDQKRMTWNMSLLYSKSTNFLLRTCINGLIESGTTTVQVYDLKTLNLVAEKTLPGAMDFLYSNGDTFYGVNIMPRTNKNYIYRFKVAKK